MVNHFACDRNDTYYGIPRSVILLPITIGERSTLDGGKIPIDCIERGRDFTCAIARNGVLKATYVSNESSLRQTHGLTESNRGVNRFPLMRLENTRIDGKKLLDKSVSSGV
jgi:hypothetical protein